MPKLRPHRPRADQGVAARRAVRITQKAMWEMAALDPPAHVDDVVETFELSP